MHLLSQHMQMLILFQAMILAREYPDFNDIYQTMKGFIFLGTPHRGFRSPATSLLGNIQLSGKFSMVSTNARLLKNLKEGSDLLRDISSRFSHCLADLRIVSFYEQIPTSVVGLLVTVSDLPYHDLGQLHPNEIL